MNGIEIDDEVYSHLERHVRGFEQPNDVLRRLLLTDVAPTERPKTQVVVFGRLHPLVQAGLLESGDVLIHERPRKGDRFEATVTAGGCIVIGGVFHKAPSPALSSLVGTQIDGWKHWTHERSGKTLRQLRWELDQWDGETA